MGCVSLITGAAGAVGDAQAANIKRTARKANDFVGIIYLFVDLIVLMPSEFFIIKPSNCLCGTDKFIK
jgi:hypothetical protein